MKSAVPLSEAVARGACAPRAQLRHGSCRCGTLRFAVRIDTSGATRCICARCRGAGSGQGLRIAHADRAAFRLLTGAEDLTEPLSDARTPHHFFCGRCGEPGFGFPPAGSGPGAVTVNLAFLDRGGDVDPSTLPPPD